MNDKIAQFPAKSPTPVKKQENIGMTLMTFPEAMAEVIKGKHVTKLEWGTDKIQLFLTDFLYIQKEDGEIAPLLVSSGDMIGTDWIIV